MNYDQLKAFIAVVEHHGFTSAAKSLHRSQPAVTNAVKTLEDRIGFKLFARDAYRATLTPKGEEFFIQAKNAIEKLDSLSDYANLLKTGIEPKIAIAIDCIVQFENYLPLFNTFTEKYPTTEFQFYTEIMKGNIERILSKEAAIAICVNLAPDDVELDLILLETVTKLPVASKVYYEANQARFDDPEQHHKCMQVIIRDSSREMEKMPVPMINKDAHTWTVSDQHTRKQIILQGMGWGRLPRHMIQEELTSGKVIQLGETLFPAITYEIYAIRLKNTTHGIIASEIWNELKK